MASEYIFRTEGVVALLKAGFNFTQNMHVCKIAENQTFKEGYGVSSRNKNAWL